MPGWFAKFSSDFPGLRYCYQGWNNKLASGSRRNLRTYIRRCGSQKANSISVCSDGWVSLFESCSIRCFRLKCRVVWMYRYRGCAIYYIIVVIPGYVLVYLAMYWYTWLCIGIPGYVLVYLAMYWYTWL